MSTEITLVVRFEYPPAEDTLRILLEDEFDGTLIAWDEEEVN